MFLGLCISVLLSYLRGNFDLLVCEQVYIVLTGGTKTCHDLGYFEYMVQQIPKSDVAASLDRIAAENEDLIGRLPKEVSSLHQL